MVKEIGLFDVAREAIKQDKDFLKQMIVGDTKAIILNDGVVIVFNKIKEISKKKSEMEMIICLNSIRVDASLIDDEDLENDE